MIITRENERLYLRPLDYNLCKVFTALAEIIVINGGKVKPKRYKALISDRNIKNSDIIQVEHTGYITFILENMVYYFQVDDNPFFPFYYTKTPLINNKYSLDATSDETGKEWLCDSLLNSNCPQNVIDKAANMIFEELYKSPISKIYRSSHRVRVPNTYNNGWHWETKQEPERFEIINW